MAQLPFLVVHGALVSRMLVVIAGVLGVAAMWALRRRREAREVASERQARGAAVSGLTPGRVTIMGTLRGRAATGVSELGIVVRERDDALSLDVGGTVVELRGDVEVIAGTRAAASWRRMRAGVLREGQAGAWRARELRAGDEVIARGELSNVAGDTGGDYRESAGVWVLEPVATTPVIELYAARPAVHPAALHPARIAAVGVLWAGISYCALWWAGAALVSRAEKARAEHITSPPLGLVIASALPQVRQGALEELDHRFQYEMPSTDDVVAMRFELAELLHGCHGRARLELTEEHFQDALATASRCDDSDAEVDALVHLGRYREAANVLATHATKWQPRAALVSIVVGDWARAARATDAMARDRVSSDTPVNTTGHEPAIDRDRCLTAWFGAKAGDAAAAAKLAALAPDNIGCDIVRAMMLPPDQRRSALLAVGPSGGDDDLISRILAGQLAFVYGGPETNERALDLYDTLRVLTGDESRDARLWLSAIAMATHPTADPGALAERAALDVVRGDMPAASTRIAAAHATGTDDVEEIDALRQAVLLHQPGAIASDPAVRYPHPLLTPLIELRAGKTPSRELHVLTYEHDGDLARALKASLAGDAAPLAQAITTERPMWSADAAPILAIVPLMREHREQLAAALHGFHDEFAMDLDRMPFGTLAEASMHRDLARLAGDEASARRWQKLIDAQLPVLDDPDKVVALLLLQEL